MNFLFKKNWTILKEIAGEAKRNWRILNEQKALRDKIKAFPMVYFPAVFLLGFLASWYVSLLFIFVGAFMGLFLGITENPYLFLMLLLPFVGMLTLKLTQVYWTSFYPVYRKEFFKKMNLGTDSAR
ncbi:hypothetical protein [Bhargavaea cecembensis]|uniref:hypothetical protein n=1 Tax=Bhargavaea cecembensis TaxID=394098 RepID=UPI0007ABE2AC|nr:hypothetical protein [Bhargavaea cecembensis]